MRSDRAGDLGRLLAAEFAGPILFDYVWWVLRRAEEKGVKRLYFLARDGYLLYEIAKRFCQAYALPVECRYLYCSRISLRTPSYCLIGDEAYHLLLLGGYRVTLASLLDRLLLTTEERQRVCVECGMDVMDLEALLSPKELNDVREKLCRSTTYARLLQEHSAAAYPTAIGYLRQEGLFEQEIVALVDSGWTGSMQRSLRQLLTSDGFSGRVVGFYFGMYGVPKTEDGDYETWYFSKTEHTIHTISFCNNLFECLLSAPHGMTVSYEKQDENYVPVLLELPEAEVEARIKKQIHTVLDFIEQQLAQTDFAAFDAEVLRRDTARRIFRYMAHPSPTEAAFYGEFLFCDDITEGYHLKLASAEQLALLDGYSLPRRVLRKVLRQPPGTVRPDLLWPFGTIAFLPTWKRIWYRWNVYIWEWLKIVLKK